MTNQQYEEIMERLDFIEFRQELMFSNTDLDRSLIEYKITREQYRAIMDLMDEYRNLIGNGKECSNGGFEQRMYEILPERHGDYHMCEEIAKNFMLDGRWEEVFMNLYGDMLKYSHLKKEWNISDVVGDWSRSITNRKFN